MKIPADLQAVALQILLSTVLPILLILVIALVLMRTAHGAVNRIVRRLLDRETVEGTAQELSASTRSTRWPPTRFGRSSQ
jgi:4-hydroxybenzoate polyprenyltransferase